MTSLSLGDPADPEEPLAALRRSLGLLPGLFPARNLSPRIFEAESRLSRAILSDAGALSPILRESILTGLAAPSRNRPGELSPGQTALVDFAVRLGRRPPEVRPAEIRSLRAGGHSDRQILDAILVAALARFLFTLSAGLGSAPEPEREEPEGAATAVRSEPEDSGGAEAGPCLDCPEIAESGFAPFQLFRKKFGFVPNLFRAQTLRPDVLDAEAQAVRDILLPGDVLRRLQKEYILLAVAAANGNECLVAVESEILRNIGVELEDCDRIAEDFRTAGLSREDRTLLEAAVKLAQRPEDYGDADVVALHERGFGEVHILEAAAMSALAVFLHTLQRGLGTAPDFPPRRRPSDRSAGVNPPKAPARLTKDAEPAPAAPDPDAPLVARARAGQLEAFEELLRRHQSRVYRTLLGLTGNAQDAEDGTQSVFLKVFRKIGEFGGAARFSTWLTRIAINEGLERLRSRREMDSLEERDERDFRPTRVQPWLEDPETRLAREQMRQIVREALQGLPLRYRTAVLLRDIEQLSTAEAAEALDVPVATLKTRLLRGRLMLREVLAPRFMAPRGSGAV